MEDKTQIEDFFGVYLLCSQSEEKKYRGKVYIGYTVNPSRRINQHNRGKNYGGAKKTSNKGPWKMIMIIHGFPNNISALQFEWAWQSPNVSSRLKHITGISRKKSNETHFHYKFRVLSEMLRIGPWNRFPLVIRWLAGDYFKDFMPDKLPPMHMQICHGQVAIKKKSISTQSVTSTHRPASMECDLCMMSIDSHERSKVTCLNPKCELRCHIICLANLWLEPGQYVPIEGDCPFCGQHFLWGDLIRKKNGCNDLEESADCLYDDLDLSMEFDLSENESD